MRIVFWSPRVFFQLQALVRQNPYKEECKRAPVFFFGTILPSLLVPVPYITFRIRPPRIYCLIQGAKI